MEGTPHPVPRTVEEVFSDFKGRRAGLIKALTTDVEKFYQQCDPEKENLCLYGLPNETWEVNLPVEEVPPELPEPALGINFARDGMQEKDWLSLVAVHSDSWLLAVAFYFGARFGFGKNERKRLFQMINDLPTIFEVVTGNAKQQKDQSGGLNNSKSKSSSKMSRPSEGIPLPERSPRRGKRVVGDDSAEIPLSVHTPSAVGGEMPAFLGEGLSDEDRAQLQEEYTDQLFANSVAHAQFLDDFHFERFLAHFVQWRITERRKEVAGLKDQIETLTTQATTLKADLGASKSEVSTLQLAVTDREQLLKGRDREVQKLNLAKEGLSTRLGVVEEELLEVKASLSNAEARLSVEEARRATLEQEKLEAAAKHKEALDEEKRKTPRGIAFVQGAVIKYLQRCHPNIDVLSVPTLGSWFTIPQSLKDLTGAGIIDPRKPDSSGSESDLSESSDEEESALNQGKEPAAASAGIDDQPNVQITDDDVEPPQFEVTDNVVAGDRSSNQDETVDVANTGDQQAAVTEEEGQGIAEEGVDIIA